MYKFIKHTGTVVPIDLSNIDTDVIIPKQFLQKITKTGFGKFLFYDWRYIENENHTPNMNFILNSSLYRQSTILLSRENFGCGSSREHAVWALVDYGFKVVIASSFSDIFYSNSLKNGLLPIVFSKEIIDSLFNYVNKHLGVTFLINLVSKKMYINDNTYFKFSISKFHQYCLINGLDDISLTLQYESKILRYEDNILRFYRNEV